MKIVSTLDLPEQCRQTLSIECPDYQVEHIDRLADLDEKTLKEVEILFTYGNEMPEEIVAKMKSLRWIHSGQAGIDSMPKSLLADMEVFVTNSRGINSVTIAEYVLCMLLNLERNTYKFYDAYKQKKWDMETHLDEVAGRKIAILGLGKVGMEIAKRASAFDMKVLGINLTKVESPFIDEQYLPSQLKEVAGKCDYIIICMPLTSETYHLFDEDVLGTVKQGAVLVNVGRGPIVKTEAAVRALRTGKLRAAIFDVMEEEPLPADSELWNVENLLITPHIAGDRQASYMPRMMKILCDNLNRYPDFKEMENPVNVKLGF